MRSNVLLFERRPMLTTADQPRAGALAILRGRAWLACARLLNALGVPGALRSAEIEDTATGQRLAITVGPLFTRVSVNGRDFYFDRITGRYDGTGMGCR